MALDTFNNLSTSISNWLHRDDLASLIPDFIALAEEMIWKELRVKEMEDNDPVTLSTSSRYATLPTGILAIKRIYLNTSPIQKMEPMSTTQITLNYLSAAGRPKYYAVLGSQIEFERTPDSAYDAYVNYYKKLTALSASNSTNDILTYYPSVYLWGACLAGAIYTEDDQKIAKYKPLFEEAVSRANQQTKQGQYGAGMAVRVA